MFGGRGYLSSGSDDFVGDVPVPDFQAVPTPQRAGTVPTGAAPARSGQPGQSGDLLPPFDEEGYALDDRFVGRGTTFVKNIPRKRLSQCLLAISPSLEPEFTAECSTRGLLCLLWCYTRVKPTVKICDLGALAKGSCLYMVIKVNSLVN